MMKKRRGWKKDAKLALQGNYSVLILGLFVILLVNLVANTMTDFFFGGKGIFTLILAEVFSFIVSLVINIFSAGYDYMNLRVARYEKTVIRDILFFFRNNSDRVIIAGLVITIIQLIASAPGLIYSHYVPVGTTTEAIMKWQGMFLMFMMVTLILQMILTIPFSLAYYLLADHPEMSGMEAIKTSVKMMKGHMWQYLLLQLSFLPWIIGSVFTMYIALLWVLPYMQVASAEFYRDLNGEFRIQALEKYNEFPEDSSEIKE